eukprot:maker-scaffold1045_size67585-snap-gene-0.13 protein:Tk09393 transcript:maker-scaffold1045_size67585-snap-gene-0.13-mRNA-1 annotation:"GM13699"
MVVVLVVLELTHTLIIHHAQCASPSTLNHALHCRRYGPRCSGCKDVIYPSDLVRKARDQFYHLGCFTCAICQRQLHTGDKLFVMADGAFVCKEDYVTHVLHQNNNNNCSYYGRPLGFSHWRRPIAFIFGCRLPLHASTG